MKGGLKDYEFYKLVCKTDETIYYIGSTSNMIMRIRKHEASANKPNDRNYNNKMYNIMRANGGWDNFKFINLGNIKNVTKTEARHTEQAFINLFEPNMNTNNSYTTEEQKKEQMKNYSETNKEKLKEYREENKEKITQQHREWREKNKEKIKAHDKKCREKNKEKFKAREKEYYNKNKQVIAEKHKKKVTCECGCIVNKYLLPRHKLTQKHINLINN